MRIIDTGGGIRRRVPDDFPGVGAFFAGVAIFTAAVILLMSTIR